MIYRLHYLNTAYGSQGYGHFYSKKEAEQAATRYCAEDPANFVEWHEAKTPRSKTAIIALLDRWADHPDNG